MGCGAAAAPLVVAACAGLLLLAPPTRTPTLPLTLLLLYRAVRGVVVPVLGPRSFVPRLQQVSVLLACALLNVLGAQIAFRVLGTFDRASRPPAGPYWCTPYHACSCLPRARGVRCMVAVLAVPYRGSRRSTGDHRQARNRRKRHDHQRFHPLTRQARSRADDSSFIQSSTGTVLYSCTRSRSSTVQYSCVDGYTAVPVLG